MSKINKLFLTMILQIVLSMLIIIAGAVIKKPAPGEVYFVIGLLCAGFSITLPDQK